MVSHNDIIDMQNGLAVTEVNYLVQRGWLSTRNNPANIWLWKREIDGNSYLLGRAEAIQIQASLDAKAEFAKKYNG
jgi:hypothetical protein